VIANNTPEISGFILFDAFPLGTVFMIAFMILVTTFFITSADSSTLAVSMMTTGGKARPSTINRVFWGVVLGLTAAILMIIGGEGGTGALQNAVIITGAPFAFVFLAMLSLITDFSSSYGRVLLQDETVLIGSSAKLNRAGVTRARGPVESDDD